MAYKIEITPTALEVLKAIADRRTRAIIRRIDTLVEENHFGAGWQDSRV
jgi:mRNA-degrading endonuclease RelE of RelBE toxin-antitoxin system